MKSWLVRVFERARSDGASMALISQLVASISAVGISWACEAAYVRFSSHLSHSALTFGTGQRDTSSGLGLNKFWEPPQSISLILNRCAVFFLKHSSVTCRSMLGINQQEPFEDFSSSFDHWIVGMKTIHLSDCTPYFNKVLVLIAFLLCQSSALAASSSSSFFG